MTRKNEAHEMVIASLTAALLQLMARKPLDKINVSELCSRAGVSRVTFYRNFSSMKDILVRQLNRCTDDWWLDFSKREASEFHEKFWQELLGQYKKNEKLIKLLYQNDVSNLLRDHIFACCGPATGHAEEDAYARAILAGAIYGLVDEWIRRGMQDLPANFSLKNFVAAMPD